MKFLGMFTLFLVSFFIGAFALAQAAVPAPVALPDFLAQVLAAIAGFGGLSWMLKVAAIITLIIASMKVSILNTWIWSKLGAAQVWVAPVLGLIGGILSLGQGSAGITMAGVLAYVSAGAGAVVIHELLDSVKAIPGLGAVYVSVIGIIEGLLGGGSPLLVAKK